MMYVIFSMVFKKMKTAKFHENMWNALKKIKLVFYWLKVNNIYMIADYTGRAT